MYGGVNMMAKRLGEKQISESVNKLSAYKSKTDPPKYMAVVRWDSREPDEVIEHEGVEYERTDHIPIDFDAIPDCVRDDLAISTYDAVCEFLQQPRGLKSWMR
jgi:hypothetical protein